MPGVDSGLGACVICPPSMWRCNVALEPSSHDSSIDIYEEISNYISFVDHITNIACRD